MVDMRCNRRNYRVTVKVRRRARLSAMRSKLITPKGGIREIIARKVSYCKYKTGQKGKFRIKYGVFNQIDTFLSLGM